MAHEYPLDLNTLSVGEWNLWRSQHLEIVPTLKGIVLSEMILKGINLIHVDLTDAKLVNADLMNADLYGATLVIAKLDRAQLINVNLVDADLRGASVVDANLSEANLTRADLTGADLTRASLVDANLSEANLTRADLTGADLTGASLVGANLSGANLSGADLTDTQVEFTVFANNDLRSVRGLETIRHNTPSSIGVDTLERSEGDISGTFLRQAGVSEPFIVYARSLSQAPIQYYTCFISYSSRDQEFAERLYTDLQNRGVRCWFAPEDMRIGDKIRERIDESIRLYDKLILILSKNSVSSNWVAYEAIKALNKEEPVGRQDVLFPLKLDNAILLSTASWAKDLRSTRHIADFEQWHDREKYQVALSRLVRDLKVSMLTDGNGGSVDK